MYYLMNKDVEIAFFDRQDGAWKLLEVRGALPVGNFEINEWLEDRKAYKHNHHLKRLMMDCGCETTEGFIKITHAASINDSYWVKGEDERLSWQDISFYRNDFNETISKLAFEGLGLYGLQMSSTSPELTTDGSFRKCWRKEDGKIYLYKRGISEAFNAGLEPYCEAMASEIVNRADPGSVSYSLVKLHKETASKCRVFTDENTGFVPLRRLKGKNTTLQELLDYFDKLECREQFQRMLVLDAVIFNVDRHMGNIGVLVDNSTQKVLGMAPNFDFNLSMLPYVIKSEFDDIGTKLLDYGPHIGTDFTRTGQEMLTSKIRGELINLLGFQFAFRGDREFEPWRVKKMEELAERQIKAILSGEKLYTKDVFIPKAAMHPQVFFDNTGEHKKAEILIAKLKESQGFSAVMEEIGEDGHISVRATIYENEGFVDIIIRMEDGQVCCEKDGIAVPATELSRQSVLFGELYGRVCILFDFLAGD